MSRTINQHIKEPLCVRYDNVKTRLWTYKVDKNYVTWLKCIEKGIEAFEKELSEIKAAESGPGPYLQTK